MDYGFPFAPNLKKQQMELLLVWINVLKLRFVRILLIEFSFCLKIIWN